MGSYQSVGAMFIAKCDENSEKVAIRLSDKPTRTPISYGELKELVKRFAAQLLDRGLKRGDTICVYSENCLEWAATDWACMTLGVALVPIYPTLPGDQAAYIVQDCGAKLVLCGGLQWVEKLSGLVKVETGLLHDFAASAKAGTLPEGFDSTWNEYIEACHPEDLATIIYTSGTTGSPKGAVLPHRAFTALCENISSQLPVSGSDTFLSWLPMSHVYERFAGHILPVGLGATIAYSGGLAALAGDMVDVKPTVVLCVPRFLEATRDKIMDAAHKQGGLKSKLFDLALAQGKAKRRGQFAPFAGLLDKIVAQKIREKTGGNIRFFVSGGGALPVHVSEFYRAFGIDVLQGYGLTETCAATSVNHPERNLPHTVGEAIRGLEIKLAADGEILIRGYSVMTGYFNLPEETAQAIDADGWFHTGDIGEFEGTHLKITDRKKDLIVLGNGKNVAPQPIENKLRESAYIAEVALFGDGMTALCGLIIPDFERLKAFAKEQGVNTDDPTKLLALPAIRDLIKKEIDAVNKRLADFERVKRFEMLDAPFTVDGGELTPSLKVKRKVVKEKYADLIAGMTR